MWRSVGHIWNLISTCYRPERFLQLCSDDPEYFPPEDEEFAVKQLSSINMIVANCSTPANYAHMLRRQIKLPFRKPLVVMTPKSLLRLPECKSSFDDLLPGTEFKRMILDNGPASENPAAVQKILFCTGKVYYDLLNERKKAGLEDKIAIHTIEQICPFPFDIMKKVITLMAILKNFIIIQLIESDCGHLLQCWAVLRARRTQEHGCLVLCPGMVNSQIIQSYDFNHFTKIILTFFSSSHARRLQLVATTVWSRYSILVEHCCDKIFAVIRAEHFILNFSKWSLIQTAVLHYLCSVHWPQKILQTNLFMKSFLKIIFAQYIGRETAPSPATGSKATHKKELSAFLTQVWTSPKRNYAMVTFLWQAMAL